MNRIFLITSFAGLVLALTACGDDNNNGGTDAGMTVDLGTSPTDGGAGVDMARTDAARDSGGSTSIPTCAAPSMVTGVLDTTSTVMVNTTGGPEGVLALTGCGATEQTAPQAVVAYVVPGTGDVAVQFTTDTAGSDATLDTVVEVITDGACTDEPVDDSGCFDDIDYPDNTKSGGGVTATGGSTIYFVLTGYGDTAGAIQLDINAFIAAPPVLSTATFNIGDVRVYGRFTGTDANGDVDHLTARFIGSDSMTIDVNDDGMVDASDTLDLDFTDSVAGMESFVGELSFHGAAVTQIREFNAATVEFTVVDSAGVPSPALTVPVTSNSDAAGATCSAEQPCGDVAELTCTAGTCTVVAGVATECAAATPIVIAAPAEGSGASTTVTGTTGTGAGALGGTCYLDHLTAAIYTVTVPAGAYDLVARTDVTGTDAAADTVLSIRSTCADLTTQLACNDDIGSGENRSLATVEAAAAGTYTVIVDQFVNPAMPPTAGLPYGLTVSLRSVIGAGATCDPAGVLNRCSTGPCPATGTAVCPAAAP
ncbi:MAG: hypothetical protein IPK60_17290 [Sandaracinaceae bacterium]|jgi:hypothetical protein|nr:hypothetical protein [Sandaracinaceae bacterium]